MLVYNVYKICLLITLLQKTGFIKRNYPAITIFKVIIISPLLLGITPSTLVFFCEICLHTNA